MDTIGPAHVIAAVTVALTGLVTVAIAISVLRGRVGGGRRARRRDVPGRAPGRPDAGFDGRDADEISDVFERIVDEAATDPIGRLRVAAEAVIRRQVPLRWVRAAPRFPLGRLGFADGTVLLARGKEQADLSHLAMVVATRRTVLPVDCRVEDDGLVLDLRWDRGQLRVDIVALDQAD